MSNSTIKSGITALLFAAAVMAPAEIQAQVRQVTINSSVRDIATYVTASDSSPVSAFAAFQVISTALANAKSAASVPRRDSIASALVDLAVTAHHRTGGYAVTALVVAGDTANPDRYEGAFAHLVRIITSGGREAGPRAAALRGLAKVGSVPQAVRVWDQMAQAPTDAGFIGRPLQSVLLLCRDGGQEGRRILLDLYRRGAVTDQYASAALRRSVESEFTSVDCRR